MRNAHLESRVQSSYMMNGFTTIIGIIMINYTYYFLLPLVIWLSIFFIQQRTKDTDGMAIKRHSLLATNCQEFQWSRPTQRTAKARSGYLVPARFNSFSFTILIPYPYPSSIFVFSFTVCAPSHGIDGNRGKWAVPSYLLAPHRSSSLFIPSILHTAANFTDR